MVWYGTSICSEPLYVAFHDEEWGVPVHDDRMLFELLTLSQALGELTWPSILSKREEFRYAAQNWNSVHSRAVRTMSTDGFSLCTRDIFDGFNLALVSEFTEKINLLRSNGILLLSEQKIRAVVTNAKHMQKVQESVFLQLFAFASNLLVEFYLWWTRIQCFILLSALVIRLNANILMFFLFGI